MSIEFDPCRAPAHQLEDAIKKVETSVRREWPVYREITRQERADRASAELLESERRGQDRVREFQRQNDKFIGREPKVRRSRVKSQTASKQLRTTFWNLSEGHQNVL